MEPISQLEVDEGETPFCGEKVKQKLLSYGVEFSYIYVEFSDFLVDYS
jgi:hypothetical protein